MVASMISEGEAYGITYGALGVFAVVAGIALPSVVSAARHSGTLGADFWYSARNSQGGVSLGLSCFASSMGAWVLFAAPEVGVLSGWWGVFGYAIASALPFVVLCFLGPPIRARFPDGFSLVDWVKVRYGRPTQIYVGLASVFYMWIYLVAELTSMGNLISDFAGLAPLHALIPVSVVTMLYTMIGGLNASIWTDRVQGMIMTIFVIVAIVACFSGLRIAPSKWKQVSEGSDAGFESFLTLILAIIGAELFNMSNWQRVYAAKDETQFFRGALLGSFMIFLVMILFGLAGMLAQAQDMTRQTPKNLIPALTFFDLLSNQPKWISILAYALATCMVASSVDSLQTGLVSVLSREIMQRKLTPFVTTLIGQSFVLLVNVAAIILAADATPGGRPWREAEEYDTTLGWNIISLFLIADLVLLSITVPIFAGLGSLATQNGALAGCFAGLVFIMAYGWCEFGTFVAGLEMMTLMAFGNVKPTRNGFPDTGLGAPRTTIIFFLLPIITGVVTFMVSWMERVLEELQPFSEKTTNASKELQALNEKTATASKVEGDASVLAAEDIACVMSV